MTKVSHYKPEAYDQAVSFRKRGFTYSEIAKICDVSVGTVSNWLKNESFSKVVAKDNAEKAVLQNTKRLSLINKARNSERNQQYAEIIRLASVEYKNYCTSPLFTAGLIIYASLGDIKPHGTIRLTSSQYETQAIFIRFVLTYLGVSRDSIHLWLLLYPDLDEVRCMKFWIKKTGLSASHFYKNQIINGQSNKSTLHFGVLNTIIGSTLLKKKLLCWLELINKDLIEKK